MVAEHNWDGGGGAIRLRQYNCLVTDDGGCGRGVQGEGSSEDVQWLRDHSPAKTISYVLLIGTSGANLQCYCNCCGTNM